MDAKDNKPVDSPSTTDVSGARSPVSGETCHKKRSKKPAKNARDVAGKAESAVESPGHAATKTKTPDKEAVVSTPKHAVTEAAVRTTGGEKRHKKPSKKQNDVGKTTAKDDSAVELSRHATMKTQTLDKEAVISSPKDEVPEASVTTTGGEKHHKKPSKKQKDVGETTAKDGRRTASEAAYSPGKPEDARPQSSAAPGGATLPAQPASTTSAVPVPAQGNAKNADSPADMSAFEERNYTRTILTIIGAVVLALGILGVVVLGLLVLGGPIHGTRAMFAAPVCGASWRSQPVPVSTTSGEFVGKTGSVDGVEVNCWLGIPYAESTAGNNRFHKPVPRIVKERTLAHDPRPPCPQWVNGTVVGSEDCLHVNVWAPKGNSATGSKRTLVLASSGYWFQRGSNNDPDWAQLAVKADVVVMSPNVRLGVLGFLHPIMVDEDFVKDVAEEDAKAAVKWAVANAAAFGARSDAVVLVGHGSGAYVLIEAVHSLNIKCSRAILEGPVPGSLWPLNTGVLEPSEDLARFMKCSDDDWEISISPPCLANTSVEALLSEAARLKFRFAPSLEELQLISKDPPLEIPEVIAGVDIDQVRTFFNEYVRPLAVATGHASSLAAVLDFTLTYFLQNGSLAYNTSKQGLSAATLATESHLLNGLALYMGGCDTRSLVQMASLKGFHYITDGVGKPLFEPVLDMAAVVNFIKDGSVPQLKNGQPWEPWKSSNTTRIELVADTGALTQDRIAKLCKPPF